MTAIAATLRKTMPEAVRQRLGEPTTLVVTKAVQPSSTITLTIPDTMRAFDLKLARFEFTASATVGTRTMTLEIRDGNGVLIYDANLTAATTDTVASATLRLVLWARATAAVGTGASASDFIPQFVLPAGYTIVMKDRAGISATDTLGLTLFGYAL